MGDLGGLLVFLARVPMGDTGFSVSSSSSCDTFSRFGEGSHTASTPRKVHLKRNVCHFECVCVSVCVCVFITGEGESVCLSAQAQRPFVTLEQNGLWLSL